MPAGRPPMYETPEDMQAAIDAYFAQCDAAEKPYTITGLALALGFANRQSLLDYAEKDEFSGTVKRAKGRVEEFLETRLFAQSVAGVIFNLKNNFGWRDKTEQELSTKDGQPIFLWGTKSE